MKYVLFFILTSLLLGQGYGQTGVIQGRVKDAQSNQGVELAELFVLHPSDSSVITSVYTDENGEYKVENLEAGFYTVEVSYLSYTSFKQTELSVVNNKPTTLNISLMPITTALDEIVIKGNAFETSRETPLSTRSIGITEIRRNPGAAQDISKVFKIFPGVTSPPVSYRNDLFIRGGGPNENSFYLEGIQVPVINHFTTQGSSGGPAGMINPEFIENVKFLSSAFPAERYNALSSVFDFEFRDGRNDRVGGTFTLGSTNAGITMEGPIGDDITFLASVRRSYLQLLFSVIDLPFLPSFWDFQTKVTYSIKNKHEFKLIGLGAIDKLLLNTDAYNSEENAATLERLPELNQWNYTTGLTYRYFANNGVWQAIISQSLLDNTSFKYKNNDDSVEDNLEFKYQSQEQYRNLRFERLLYMNDTKVTVGIRYQHIRYTNQAFSRIYTPMGAQQLMTDALLKLNAYSVYVQGSKTFLNNRWSISAGFNISGNDYSKEFRNLFEQFSPRLATSYELSKFWTISASVARFFQTPSLTLLGYKPENTFVNREHLLPIQADHAVIGVSCLTQWDSKISIEAYVKKYRDYPFLTRDSINLANEGGDFGVVGNAPASSIGGGRTYGMEVLFQQKLYKGLYGLVSYTLGWSEFTDNNGHYIPSSWDTRHILNINGGWRLKKGWELGISYRYQSSFPTTPFDPASALVQQWDINKEGIKDYDELNTIRTEATHQVNARIDKKWFFNKWTLNLYLDVENVFADGVPVRQMILDRPLNDQGVPQGNGEIENPNAPENEQRYKVKILEENSGIIVPTLGVIIGI